MCNLNISDNDFVSDAVLYRHSYDVIFKYWMNMRNWALSKVEVIFYRYEPKWNVPANVDPQNHISWKPSNSFGDVASGRIDTLPPLWVLFMQATNCKSNSNWLRCRVTSHVISPSHHGMERPRVAHAGDGLQPWRVPANRLNKQSRPTKKRCSYSLGGWVTG